MTELAKCTAVGSSLSTFILQLVLEGRNNSPLMEVHWRWNETAPNGSIPVLNILYSLFFLCSAEDAPTWEEIVTWNLDRVCRLLALEKSDFCLKLDRLLSSPKRAAIGAFPTLDLKYMMYMEPNALGTLFQNHATSIRTIDLDIIGGQISPSSICRAL